MKNLTATPMDEELKSILIHYASSLEIQGVEAVDSLVSIYLLDTTDDSETLGSSWGSSPLANPWSGVRFNAPGFHPYWEHLIQHHQWFEMLCLVGDDGAGRIIFIPKGIGDDELLEMCRMHSQRG